MSLHLGLHWGTVMGSVRRITGPRAPSKYRTAALRLLAAAVSFYGLHAFFRSGLPDQTVPQFLMDDAAVMGLFLAVAHYGGMFLRRRSAGHAASK